MKVKLFFAFAAIVGMITILGIVGNVDYADQVILSMSQEEYDSVRNHLTAENGEEPSEIEIAKYFMEHQE